MVKWYLVPFQALMKQVHRKDNVEALDAKFALFDVLTLKEFKQGGIQNLVVGIASPIAGSYLLMQKQIVICL